MNARQSFATTLQVCIAFAAAAAYLVPELVLMIGAAQTLICYVCAARYQERRHILVHMFLVSCATGVIICLIALSSMVVIWAGAGEGVEETFRCVIALCFLVAVARIWILLMPATFRELDKFFRRLASP